MVALWTLGGLFCYFFFSSRRRHTRWPRDWSSDVCSSDLQCLQRVAEVLREVVTRPADLVARYGGEEVTVLLPECSPEGAEHIAGQIHRQLEAAAIPFARSPTAGQPTVCIRLAIASPQPNQPASLAVA